METGVIFDIQRFSIHDGPGIRTLVFLKGCPLNCPWCSNPESQKSEPELLFHPEKCIGCMTCINACPQEAIMNQDGQLSFNRSLCINCGKCCLTCFAEARIMKGKVLTVEQVLNEVLKDSAFYANSGGGVTLGGGEPLIQSDFASAILRECVNHGLHTAVETAGHIQWDILEKVIPYTNLFLYDVKHMDPQFHKEWLGVDNRLILENLAKLVNKTSVILRVPLIPGFNTSSAQLGAIASYGLSIGLKEIQLLPYHRFGEGKYRLLDRQYPFSGTKELTIEEQSQLRRAVEEEGMRVQIGG